MNARIFTPRAHYNMYETHDFLRKSPNRQTNTIIEVGDYQISMAMDSSLGPGDLTRTEILVFKKKDENDNDFSRNVTYEFKKLVCKELCYVSDMDIEQMTLNSPFELSVILNEIIKIDNNQA